MNTYRIAWKIEGSTEIEAESEDEARAKFAELSESKLAERDMINLEVLAVGVKPEEEK